MGNEKSEIPEFELWYEQNYSYYKIKHDGNEESMREDALRAHMQIKHIHANPSILHTGGKKQSKRKKKPNPYGFDRDE